MYKVVGWMRGTRVQRQEAALATHVPHNSTLVTREQAKRRCVKMPDFVRCDANCATIRRQSLWVLDNQRGLLNDIVYCTRSAMHFFKCPKGSYGEEAELNEGFRGVQALMPSRQV